jgi:hypothetical protein
VAGSVQPKSKRRWVDVAEGDEKGEVPPFKANQPFSGNGQVYANMQFQPTLVGSVGQTPQQQFSARNAQLLQQGYTLSPITGQVYRLSAPRLRTQQFVDLQKQYDSARSAMIAYCRLHNYNFDRQSKKTFNEKGAEIDVSQDPEFIRLRKTCDFAKTAIKSYKQQKPAEFVPVERKRRRNLEALKRAAERRLARLASRQVFVPSMGQATASAVPVATNVAIPATAAVPASAVPNASTGVTSADIAKLSQMMGDLIKKVSDLDGQLENRILSVVHGLSTEDNMSSSSGNE